MGRNIGIAMSFDRLVKNQSLRYAFCAPAEYYHQIEKIASDRQLSTHLCKKINSSDHNILSSPIIIAISSTWIGIKELQLSVVNLLNCRRTRPVASHKQ